MDRNEIIEFVRNERSKFPKDSSEFKIFSVWYDALFCKDCYELGYFCFKHQKEMEKASGKRC